MRKRSTDTAQQFYSALFFRVSVRVCVCACVRVFSC